MRQLFARGLLVLALAMPAAAQTLDHPAENDVPAVLEAVRWRGDRTEVVIRITGAVPGVCWFGSGPDSPYLIAQGTRFRFLGTPDSPVCPDKRDFQEGERMTLRFEPMSAKIASFSLVEGEGGERQFRGETGQELRYWNFVRVALP